MLIMAHILFDHYDLYSATWLYKHIHSVTKLTQRFKFHNLTINLRHDVTRQLIYVDFFISKYVCVCPTPYHKPCLNLSPSVTIHIHK